MSMDETKRKTELIARACPTVATINEEGDWVRKGYPVRKLFNPVHDLNDMHECEKTLQADEVDAYSKNLKEEIHKGCRVCDFQSYPGDYEWHASSEQRADAFIATKGLK